MTATMALTGVRMRLALRNRAFIFFTVVMPIAFLFGFFLIFGRGGPLAITYLLAVVLALSVMGSFCCEKFGVDRFRTLTRAQIDGRYQEFKAFTEF